MKKHISFVFFAIVAFLSFFGCSKKKETVALNSARIIRLADQPSYFNIKVALEKGFFKEEFGDEYKFELSTFLNGPAINESFVAGFVDFAQLGDTPIIQAAANQVPEIIVSTLWVSDNAYALITGSKSSVNSVNDLKGSKIGIQIGTNPHKFALKVLKSLNLSTKDVQIVNIPNADVVASLNRGDIDSGTFMQPGIEDAAKAAGGKVIAYNGGYSLASCYNIVSKKFAEENPDTVSRILLVLDRSDKWISQNKEEASEIVAKISGTTKEKMYQYLTTREWITTWKPEYTNDIQDSIDFALSQNSISVKLDAKKLVDTSYLKKAGLYKED